MKIPMYILGLLQRFGPQHGYQIKKIISDQIANFTQIKLPVIYYHLDKMEKEGLLTAKKESSLNKTNKTVYSITDKGTSEFRAMIKETLNFEYKPEFINDALFYFLDSLSLNEIYTHFEQYITKLEASLRDIVNHRNDTRKSLSKDAQNMSSLIFSHHEHHYKAELNWTMEILENLRSMN